MTQLDARGRQRRREYEWDDIKRLVKLILLAASRGFPKDR